MTSLMNEQLPDAPGGHCSNIDEARRTLSRQASTYSLATTVASDEWFVEADPALIRITGPFKDSLESLCERMYAEALEASGQGSEASEDSAEEDSLSRPQQLLHTVTSKIKREADAAKDYFECHLRHREYEPSFIQRHSDCLDGIRELPSKVLRHKSLVPPRSPIVYDPAEEQRIRQLNKLDEGINQVPGKARRLLGLEVGLKAKRVLGITDEDEKGGPLIPERHKVSL